MKTFVINHFPVSHNFPVCLLLSQGVHGQGKSQGKTIFLKVRQLSGNFKIVKGNLKMKQKVRESQEILK